MDYAEFAEFINQLVQQPGNWQDKKDELDRAMVEHSGTDALEILVSWYEE